MSDATEEIEEMVGMAIEIKMVPAMEPANHQDNQPPHQPPKDKFALSATGCVHSGAFLKSTSIIQTKTA